MRLTALLVFLLAPAQLCAQQPVTRADAVAAALLRGARVALGRADTTAALGAARAARAFPNPTVSGSYSKDTPNYHALGELPLDLPWLRSPRIGAAEAARDAVRYRFAFERAAIRFDVDTTYTRGLAAALHARLSRRTARDADSLLRIAELRREVGDVSELDVRLAAVNAGQLANVAANDSLAALAALVSLQLQMGLTGAEPTIALVDSLRVPPDSVVHEGPVLLPIAAAEASLRSAERSLALARRISCCPSSGSRCPSRCSTSAAAMCCVRPRSGTARSPSSTSRVERPTPPSRARGASWRSPATDCAAPRSSSRAPIASRSCHCKPTAREPSHWRAYSRHSATRARSWRITSTTSPARMRQSVRCDCSPRVRTSREPPRVGEHRTGGTQRRLRGRQRQLGERTGRLSRTRSARRLHRRGDSAAVPAYPQRDRDRDAPARPLCRPRPTRADARGADLRGRGAACRQGRSVDRIRAGTVRRGSAERCRRAGERRTRVRARRAAGSGGRARAEGQWASGGRPRGRAGGRGHRASCAGTRDAARPAQRRRHPHERGAGRLRGRDPAAGRRRRPAGAGHRLQRLTSRSRPDSERGYGHGHQR